MTQVRKAALLARVEALEKALADSLEQQTATSEILRTISRSPTELGPVLAAVAENAARLCEAGDIGVFQLDGDILRAGARYGTGPKQDIGSIVRIRRDLLLGHTLLERRTIHVHDMAAELKTEYPGMRSTVERFGMRTMLCTPLLSGGQAVGVIVAVRYEVRPFSDKHIQLLETFADQAVIAIENVRLFTELQEKNRALTEAHDRVSEALEQQTATSEILRVISQSPTDTQPVFDAIVERALRLSEATVGAVAIFDGELIHVVASNLRPDSPILRVFPMRPSRTGSLAARTVFERQIIHVPDALAEPEYNVSQQAAESGYRSVLSVPMLRDGTVVGTIIVGRSQAGRYLDRQISLLQTFADQAVIAIENVRLFKELESRNRDLTEALEQQTATGDILKVISRSQTDVLPVFEAIAESALRLCDAKHGVVFLFDGELIHLAAITGTERETTEAARRSFPQAPGRASATTRAIQTLRAVVIPDVLEDPEFQLTEIGRVTDFRSVMAVPMLRGGKPIGAVTVTRAAAAPFPDTQVALLQTFADQAVIAIENVRLFTELQTSNRELTTALDQQTATSDILRVISRSQTDVQPVFDAIVESAVRLLEGHTGELTRIAGDQVELAALTSTGEAGNAAFKALFPRPLHAEGTHAEAIRDRAPVNLADAHTDPRLPETLRAAARARGFRSRVVVPMLHHDQAVGAIAVTRREPGGFTPDEIALLQTFADQAVIAIENVRLFTELQEKNSALTVAHAQATESLEQQTATSQILRVISSSPTDLQPVLDTVVASAARYCGAYDATMLHLDGGSLRLAAHHGPIPIPVGRPIPVVRGTTSGRAVLERRAVHVTDIQAEAEEFPESRAFAKELGYRTQLSVPLLREGAAIGTIVLRRIETNPFTDKQIALLQTFADQAVIAIENVRLFKELEARNRDLTATGDILQVIARSPTDVQPVFDTIVRSAGHLCEATFSAVVLVDGDELTLVAAHGEEGEAMAVLRDTFPRPLGCDTATGRAVIERRAVHLPDVQADPEYHSRLRAGLGTRTMLAVPMLREGAPIGAIGVWRHEVRPFTDNQLALLQTFADQAVIAIENVRLFKELETRTGELTRSVRELTALGEVSQALSSTLDIETVLDTIVSRASQLVGDAGCSIYEYDEATEHFELRATHHYDADFVEALRAAPLRKGEGVMGRAAEMREPIQIPDITQPGAYQSSVRDTLIRFGYRALLSVPLLREDQIIGSLSFNRKAPGEFPPEVVDVLKTFATQSALAIQNARLFREIADKSQQLEAASRHKSEFLANMSHELRTPLNAIIGFSEVLAQGMFGEINEKQTEYLKDILESGRHLLSLINDILDLSKIEAGRMELERADFDLPSAIENALVLVRERAIRRGIRLGSKIDKRLGMISGDERKVKQVLLNLLSNALKFTPEGGQIDVAARQHDDLAEVSVADTGVGIAPEDQEAVFEEFRQVGTADKKAEGTGLGLALTRKFIELHGGRIWVTSQVGVGSTFTFTLPERPWTAS